MATFPAITMFLRRKEVPKPFVPAINSFWYLMCNKILGYCERPEELAILISVSRLPLRMCGIYLSNIILAFAKNYACLQLLALFTSYSPLLGCAGDWVKTVLWDAFLHSGKFVAQNSPTMHFHNHLDPVSCATSKWRVWSRTFWTFITWNIRKACYSITFSYY